MKKRTRPLRRLRGYSLVELLVVVGMIGLFSLVTVPPMLSYMGQIRVRSATRVLNGDLRAARQRAITRNNPVTFSFLVGDADPGEAMEKGRYAFFDREGTTPPFTWRQVGPTKYLEGVSILPTGFTDTVNNDTLMDITFRPNGTISNFPNADPVVVIRTERDVMNNRVTDTFSVAGSFTTTLTTD
jgi:type II secretory pathway pseudopilin PulG